MALTRAYVGTSSIGASALALANNRMYVKLVSLAAGDFLAAIEVRLNTTDNESVTVKPVVYDNNGGVPGKLVVVVNNPDNTIEFNGVDRWVTLPVGYYAEAAEDVWIGFHPADPGNLTLAHETTGGDDRQVGSGGSWTIDPGAAGGSNIDPGSHLYSIRGSVVTPTTDSKVGTDTVGSAWLTLTTNTVYLRSAIIPANSVLAAVVGHLRHQVANVPNLMSYVFEDSGGVPARLLFASASGSASSILMSTTGRWLRQPVGRWFAAQTTVWIGFQVVTGAGATIDLAHETSGGDGGTLASAADAATWTAGDDLYSIYALVLT